MKTGLLCSTAIISTVAQTILDLRSKTPLVVDPVITATGGDPLLESDAVDTYATELFPLATLITPNLDEAVQLGADKIRDRESMERAGKEFERKFKTAILLKGGHLRQGRCRSSLCERKSRRICRAVCPRRGDARDRLHLFRRHYRRSRCRPVSGRFNCARKKICDRVHRQSPSLEIEREKKYRRLESFLWRRHRGLMAR